MRLLHYTEDPLDYDAARTYEQSEPRTFGKPHGLWVSVPGEDDWINWCIDNEFHLDALKHVQQVALAPDANILMVEDADGLQAFHDRYSVEDAQDQLPPLRFSKEYIRKSRPIDWAAVTADHDGIIIAPYQWSCRMTLDFYYGWDVASGCIWNLSAIAAVEARSELPAESPCS
jgi:hypothetical protein